MSGSAMGWSPDSSSLLVVVRNRAAVVADLRGGRRAVSHGGVSQAAWSPDGRWIAVVQHRRYVGPSQYPDSSRLYVVRPDGSGMRLLLDGTNYNLYCPDEGGGAEVYGGIRWSRDSDEVAVYAWPLIDEGRDGTVLCAETRITTLDGATRLEDPLDRFVPAAAWSRDGTVHTLIGPDSNILEAIYRDGTRETIVKTHKFGLLNPQFGSSESVWSPDGKSVVYLSCRYQRSYNLPHDCRAVAATRDPSGWRIVKSIALKGLNSTITVVWR